MPQSSDLPAQPQSISGVTVPLIIGASLRDELGHHLGRWVAVDPAEQRVLATGSTLRQVAACATAAGYDDPLVFRVPAQPQRRRLL